MPIENLSGSTVSTPASPYKSQQSAQQPAAPTRAEPKEEGFSVEISQKALDLQKRDTAVQAETDQRIQNDRAAREQADQMHQKQQAEAKEYTKQQSIDIRV